VLVFFDFVFEFPPFACLGLDRIRIGMLSRLLNTLHSSSSICHNVRNMSITQNFESTGSLLLDLLTCTNSETQLASLLTLVDRWSEDYDRGERQDAADGCNQMHLVGAALCVLLHRYAALGAAEYDLRGALVRAGGRVLLCDKLLAEYDIEELQHLVTALQLEFTSLYALDQAAGGAAGESSSAGYWALVNVEDICVRIMGQLGSLLTVKQKSSGGADGTDAADNIEADADAPAADTPAADIPAAAVRGLLDVDADCFCSVRTETFVFMLDALHSMYSLHALLTRAHFLPPAGELAELHAHHREASNETFFTHSMTSDCVVGTIAQYAHRFAHLFHSVSQTIANSTPGIDAAGSSGLASCSSSTLTCRPSSPPTYARY
jgi:hypothetical protein